MQAWEYQRTEMVAEGRMAELGLAGWELVAVVQPASPVSPFGGPSFGRSPGPIMFWKRPVQPVQSVDPHAGYCQTPHNCMCGGDTPAVRAGCSNWKTFK